MTTDAQTHRCSEFYRTPEAGDNNTIKLEDGHKFTLLFQKYNLNLSI